MRKAAASNSYSPKIQEDNQQKMEELLYRGTSLPDKPGRQVTPKIWK